MERKWRSLSGCSYGFGKSNGRVPVMFLSITCKAVFSAERR